MERSMIRKLTTVAVVLAAALSYPETAGSQAAHSCADRSEMVEFLARNYSEKLSAVGLINQKAIIEVYVGESGSWTMLVTNVNGQSCMVLSGEGWQSVPVLPETKT